MTPGVISKAQDSKAMIGQAGSSRKSVKEPKRLSGGMGSLRPRASGRELGRNGQAVEPAEGSKSRIDTWDEECALGSIVEVALRGRSGSRL